MILKQMVVLCASALMAFGVSAAQCEGKTKTGERCKREAAENAKFCIGHADQGKKAALKDDGTCWAVTEKGTRCKHKKDGESDYCKQHAADHKPAKPQTQCRALKYDGERCTRAPEADSLYCAQHKKLGAVKPAVQPSEPKKVESAKKTESPKKAK